MSDHHGLAAAAAVHCGHDGDNGGGGGDDAGLGLAGVSLCVMLELGWLLHHLPCWLSLVELNKDTRSAEVGRQTIVKI